VLFVLTQHGMFDLVGIYKTLETVNYSDSMGLLMALLAVGVAAVRASHDWWVVAQSRWWKFFLFHLITPLCFDVIYVTTDFAMRVTMVIIGLAVPLGLAWQFKIHQNQKESDRVKEKNSAAEPL
jgi:hypothetical protein